MEKQFCGSSGGESVLQSTGTSSLRVPGVGEEAQVHLLRWLPAQGPCLEHPEPIFLSPLLFRQLLPTSVVFPSFLPCFSLFGGLVGLAASHPSAGGFSLCNLPCLFGRAATPRSCLAALLSSQLLWGCQSTLAEQAGSCLFNPLAAETAWGI